MSESAKTLLQEVQTDTLPMDFAIRNMLRNAEAESLTIIEKAGRMSAYDLVKQLGQRVNGVNPEAMYGFLKLLIEEGKLREVNDQGFGQGNTHLIEFVRRYPDGNKNQA